MDDEQRDANAVEVESPTRNVTASILRAVDQEIVRCAITYVLVRRLDRGDKPNEHFLADLERAVARRQELQELV